MLPKFCYHNGRSFDLMIENYLEILKVMMEIDNPNPNIRSVNFGR
jgi:hypothetical protein